MPLDALPLAGFSNRYPPPSVPSLDQVERDAAGHFSQQLCRQLADQPTTNNALMLVVKMAAELKDTSVRLIHSDHVVDRMTSDETPLAWVLHGVPQSDAKRRALAVRLASAAAVAWRQRCQIHRLGLLST